MAVMTIFLVAYKSTTWQPLIFYPIAGIFAVAGKQKKSEEYSPLYGPPELVLLGGFTLFIPIAVALYVDTTRDPGRAIYIGVSSACAGLLAFYGWGMNRLTQKVPDMLEAEAIAWFLESSWSKESESELFEKANSIANTPQRKALLLGALLPHLPHLIASRVRNLPGELESFQLSTERHNQNGDDLQTFLSHLEDLLNLQESEGSFWRNEAAVKYPEIEHDLREKLDKQLLELGRNLNADPCLRQAAEAVLYRLQDKDLKVVEKA
jgi:hypothetical protein